MITIFQNIKDGSISNIENSNEKPSRPHLVDCDEDSFLIYGDFSKSDTLLLEKSNIEDNNLHPVVVLDKSKTVIMQAFLNTDALSLTFQSGFAHYYSRSRKKLWKKGEESGHTQEVLSVEYNSNTNFYIYNVVQEIAACHTGYYSCFYRKIENGREYLIYPEPVGVKK